MQAFSALRMRSRSSRRCCDSVSFFDDGLARAEEVGFCEDGTECELVELLAFAHDRPADALVSAALPAVRELVRHGLLVAPDPTTQP